MINWLEAINLIGGGLAGWILPWLDKVAYVYILHPEAQLSQYFKYHLERKNIKEALALLKKRAGELDKLTTRGILFQAAWLVLAIFALTSTTGLLGKALVIGLGLRILFEEGKDWFKDRAGFEKKLLWQIKADWSDKEMKLYLLIKTGLIIWFARLLF